MQQHQCQQKRPPDERPLHAVTAQRCDGATGRYRRLTRLWRRQRASWWWWWAWRHRVQHRQWPAQRAQERGWTAAAAAPRWRSWARIERTGSCSRQGSADGGSSPGAPGKHPPPFACVGQVVHRQPHQWCRRRRGKGARMRLTQDTIRVQKNRKQVRVFEPKG